METLYLPLTNNISGVQEAPKIFGPVHIIKTADAPLMFGEAKRVLSLHSVDVVIIAEAFPKDDDMALRSRVPNFVEKLRDQEIGQPIVGLVTQPSLTLSRFHAAGGTALLPLKQSDNGSYKTDLKEMFLEIGRAMAKGWSPPVLKTRSQETTPREAQRFGSAAISDFYGFSYSGEIKDGIRFLGQKCLTGKSARIVATLLEAGGELVSLKTITEAVFNSPDTVNPDTVRQGISSARKRLMAFGGLDNGIIECIKSGEHKGLYRLDVSKIQNRDGSTRPESLPLKVHLRFTSE